MQAILAGSGSGRAPSTLLDLVLGCEHGCTQLQCLEGIWGRLTAAATATAAGTAADGGADLDALSPLQQEDQSFPVGTELLSLLYQGQCGEHTRFVRLCGESGMRDGCEAKL